jgi:tripartite ATP-independent transporter DctP family solute receptor
MKAKKIITAVLSATLMLGTLTGCSNINAEDQPLKLVVAHNSTSTENPYHYGMLKFKEVVEDISDGEIQVEVHAGTIGTSEDELIEKLQLGAADMVIAAPGFMTKTGVPEIELLTLPYLFNDFDHWEKVTQGEFGDKLKDIIYEKTNGKFLVADYWSSGIRNYYGKNLITEPSDLKGVKIRTQSASTQQKFWGSMGAIPTQIAWNELYQALSSNVVDAAENDMTNLSLKDHHKTSNGKYVSETQHDYLTPLVLFNGPRFEKYTNQQQEWIMTAVKEATKEEVAVTKGMLERSREKILKDGGEINEVNKKAFKDIAIPIQDEFAAKINMTDMLEILRNTK